MKNMRYQGLASQGGFTLIELIVVIVILGIMAATALPKFADMSTQARTAKMQAAEGAIKSASAIAHAQWLAGGSTGSTVKIEGVDYAVVNGYPAASTIMTLAGLNSGDYTLPAQSGSTASVQADASHTTTCAVSYSEATSSAGVVTPPTVALTSSGC